MTSRSRVFAQTLRAVLVLVAIQPAPGRSLRAQEGSAFPDRPKIGLVLSGGGARGFAHVGVLQVLEDLRVPVDVITGTSMGAIVGGLYASGWAPNDIAELFGDTDWDMAMSDEPLRQDRSFRRKSDDLGFLAPLELGFDPATLTTRLPRALLEGRNVETLLEIVTVHVHGIDDFDRLPIPFRCVAADLKSGVARIFGEGRLSEAIRASMSIPGLFAPLRLDGRDYVDGGVVDNLPVRVARDLGAEVLIVVDVAFGLEPTAAEISVLDVTGQVASIMIQENIIRSRETLTEQDILIDLKLEGVDVLSFEQSGRAIDEGRETAQGKQDELARYAVDPMTWSEFLRRHRRRVTPPRIAAISIENDSRLADRLIRAGISQRRGERLDLDGLQRDLGLLDGLKVFERVGFRLQPTASPATERSGNATTSATEELIPRGLDLDTDLPVELVVLPEDRPLGPHYLQFGLDIANDFSDEADFIGKLRHTWLPANAMGGEWRNDLRLGSVNSWFSEWYQPLDASQAWFLAPSVRWQSRRDDVIANGDPIARLDLTSYRAGLYAGRVLSNWGEVRLGYEFEYTDARANLGLLSVISGDIERTYQDGYLVAQFTVDQYDAIDFPRYGTGGFLRWRGGNDGTGQDGELSTLDGRWTQPLTWGRNTLLVNLEGGYSFQTDLSPLREYRLGGFRRLSGLKPDELLGVHYGLGSLTAYRQISGRTDVVGSAWFTGLSFEVGNTWGRDVSVRSDDLRYAGSAFLAARTPVGPVYLAGGLSDGGRSAVYLYIGRGF